MNHFDVILVSSFGQLEALACELGRSGLNTLLIDVTEKLGMWPLEDREGPLGEITSDKVMGAWQEVDSQGDLPVSCASGLVVWTKEGGPVALRGPLSQHQMKIRGWMPSDTAYSKMNDFNSQWLAWLSKSFYSTRFLDWHPDHLKTSRVSLEGPMTVMFPSRSGLNARRDWLKSQNVQVWNDTEILDIVQTGLDSLSGLEVRGAISGVIKTQSLVWGLTSYETDHMSFRVREKVFGLEVNKPEWAWIRYRFQVENESTTQSWPEHMLLVENPALMLTHSEFIVIHRTVLKNQFDAWIRIPDSKRFHQAYLNRMKEDLRVKIQSRNEKMKFEFIFDPQEMSYTSKELGPRPVSQYTQKLKTKSFRQKNIYFDGPEVWEHFLSLNRFQNQKKIFELILVEWRKSKSQTLKQQEQNP